MASEGEYGLGLVWDVGRIAKDNVWFRTNEDYRERRQDWCRWTLGFALDTTRSIRRHLSAMPSGRAGWSRLRPCDAPSSSVAGRRLATCP